MSDDAPKSWERQPQDTDKSFRVFCAYRDMGRGRSLLAATTEVYGERSDKKRTKPPRHVEAWAAGHGWRERARAFDAHMDKVRQQAFEDEAQERSRLQAAAAAEVQDLALLQLLKELPSAKADVALKAWLSGVKMERAIRGQVSEVTEQRHSGSIMTVEVDLDDLSDEDLDKLEQAARVLAGPVKDPG